MQFDAGSREGAVTLTAAMSAIHGADARALSCIKNSRKPAKPE
ncbi:hypothetical protein [Christensenella minuta]|nr:hypothetical protein [Christensenella minuta]